MKHLITSILILTLSGCATGNLSWKPEEIAMLSLSWSAAFADGYTTNDVIENGGEELNPSMGSRPNKDRVYFTVGIFQSIGTGLAHCLPKYRMKILSIMTALHFGVAISNKQQE